MQAERVRAAAKEARALSQSQLVRIRASDVFAQEQIPHALFSSIHLRAIFIPRCSANSAVRKHSLVASILCGPTLLQSITTIGVKIGMAGESSAVAVTFTVAFFVSPLHPIARLPRSAIFIEGEADKL